MTVRTVARGTSTNGAGIKIVFVHGISSLKMSSFSK
jgi:hypothetical protein